MINSSTIQLKIDRSKKEQKIIGFGGAFTDATGININSLPLHMATNIIKDYFSVNGIEYSVGRIPIGGTDFSTRSYTYDDAKNDFNFIHFALQEEDIYHKVFINFLLTFY